MPPHQTETAPLSVHWAFVVHFRTDTDITQERIAGRVEHVVSGQSTHFDSSGGAAGVHGAGAGLGACPTAPEAEQRRLSKPSSCTGRLERR